MHLLDSLDGVLNDNITSLQTEEFIQ